MTLHTEVVTSLKRARTKIRRQRVTVPCRVTCHRCGGAGGAEKWRHTGYTCFQCGGAGGWPGTKRDYRDAGLREQDDAITDMIDHVEGEARYLRWLADAPARAARQQYLADWDAAVAEDRERRWLGQRWLGTVGAKLEVTGTVTTALSIATQFGNTMLVVVETDDGSLVKTFGSGRTLWGAERGQHVRISGTVKAHETYDGNKQTALSRCKIEEAA